MHPILFHLGPITIPTFGLLAALGIMAALALSLRTAPAAGLQSDALWSAGLFAISAAFVLSRLLLVVTNLRSFLSYPALLLAVPSLTPLGLLLTAAATLLFLRLRRLPLLGTLDAWSPCATLLWAFLAAGHFAEGSDPGLPTRLPFGIPMPGETIPLQPVALLTSLAALLLTGALLWHLRRPHTPGTTAALAFALAGVAQFFLTFLRQPFPYLADPAPPLDPLQAIALGMVATAGLITLSQLRPSHRSTRTETPHAV